MMKITVDKVRKISIEAFMIDIVKKIYGHNLTNYQIAQRLNKEFAMNFSEKDVNMYYEPTLEMEVADLKLIYANSVN